MATRNQLLGHAFYEYFLQRTSPNEVFTLCIDTYTYEHCAKQAGLTERDIELLLSGDGINSVTDNYSALAVVALEIKIAYDIETSESLRDSYNPRMVKNISYFGDLNEVQQFYRDVQDSIWDRVKHLFATQKRYLAIPKPYTGPYCYVQYPLSQRIISGREIIEYADRFIALHLEPFSGITFELFEGLVFNRYEYSDNEMIRRMIFSFYCMWDGRNYDDIVCRRRVLSTAEQEKKAKDEFLIQIEPEIKFYINKTKIDLTREKINDKYIWRFDENKYFTRRGTYFIKDSDYNDWLPYNRAIDAEEELLLITTQKRYPSYVEKLRTTDEIEILSAGLYSILILRLRHRESFEDFRIPVKTQPYFSLVGGLKVKRNTYYSFALPSVVLTEQEYDKTQYKSVYLDAKEYPIVDGIAQITDKLGSGKHCIKLLNSWDSSEKFFSVEDFSEASIPDNHGWIINETDGKLCPSTNMEETVIDGLTLTGNIQWIERKNITSIYKDNNELRPFLFQKERLENRFQLNRRSHYGNK